MQSGKVPTKGERIGSVSIRVSTKGENRTLQLQFSIDGKQRVIGGIGRDTPENWSIARVKATEINSDLQKDKIVPGTFDRSLAKYDPKRATLTVVEAIKPKPQLTLKELWDKWIEEQKSRGLKARTLSTLEGLSRRITADLPFDGLEVKRRLLAKTTPDQTRRTFIYLNACCKWGMKHKLCESNPFEGMSKELPQPRYVTDPKPNAFTEDERERVIEAFKTHSIPGNSYSRYAPFVEFLFLTGCRPSEAIGLKWDCVSDDFSTVSFIGSIQLLHGSPVWSEGSKNNRKRSFPCSPRLQNLLKSIKPENVNPDDLVFPSPRGSAINYNNFSRRAWDTVVDPIKPDTTPYCCRDTFITLQILKGMSTIIIAEWCDTSVGMIEKHYADSLKLTSIRPID